MLIDIGTIAKIYTSLWRFPKTKDHNNTTQYNTIRVYCENTLSYNNGVLSQTEPKSGSVKARQLIYRYSTNTIKLRVKLRELKKKTRYGIFYNLKL